MTAVWNPASVTGPPAMPAFAFMLNTSSAVTGFQRAAMPREPIFDPTFAKGCAWFDSLGCITESGHADLRRLDHAVEEVNG